VALDAVMIIRGPKGERTVNAEDYWVGPGVDITRMNILEPNELLVRIRIPATFAGAQFYFEKVRDRQVWDFPLVNVAASIKPNGGNIGDARLVVNAVAARPRRLRSVEAAIAGKPRNEETAKMAGDLAIDGAVPLRHNGYKVPLVRNLVKRAVRGSEGGTWTS
jgi:xanthine dehydrogenase YagS FAD-binding subunit